MIADLIGQLIGNLQIAGLALLPVITAAIVALLFDFGGSVKSGYYEAAAQVTVVLALAVLVEIGSILPRGIRLMVEEEGAGISEVYGTIRAALWPVVGYLAGGEAAALYAIATEKSTTFLLVLTGGAMVALGLWMILWLRIRYQPMWLFFGGQHRG